MPRLLVVLLIVLMLGWRTFYGLSQNFWHEDVIQIFLLGLKYYTTGLWPYFGPDIVHTNQQIPGALQAILIAWPLKLWPVVEAPVIFVNVLSLIGLLLMAQYLAKRFNQISWVWHFLWLCTLPMMLQISTNTYNPSYLLFPSCLFFVAFFESQPASRVLGWGGFKIGASMGFAVLFIFQLHMSWPLLLPFTAWTVGSAIVGSRRVGTARGNDVITMIGMIGGMVVGGFVAFAGLLPTALHYGWSSLWVAGTKNAAINIEAVGNIPVIFGRFLTLGTYEFMGFNLGATMEERVEVIRSHGLLLITSLVMLSGVIWQEWLVIKGLWLDLRKPQQRSWTVVVFFWSYLLVCLLFMMTPRPPVLRNFFVLTPVVLVMVVHYAVTLASPKNLKIFMMAMVATSFIFHSKIAGIMWPQVSLYKDRGRIQAAIEGKDFHKLGERRPGLY